MTQNLSTFILVFGLVSCQSALVPVSQRNFGVEKLSGNVISAGPSRLEEVDKASQVYTAKKRVQIAKKPANTTGSLYMVGNAGNELFKDKVPLKPGDLIDIKVASVHMDRKEGGKKDDKKDKEAKKSGEKDTGDGGKSDEVVDTMRHALPDLDMPEGQRPVMKYIKFRVLGVEDSGDVKLAYRRTSKNQTDDKEINITAILPKERLNQSDEVTTNDLTAIQWDETDAEQHIARSSDEWEDEYTLRLSGFSEARSRMALELEAKKQQLIEIRKQLDSKLSGFKSERMQLAKDRQKLEDTRQNMEKENRDLKAMAEKGKAATPADAAATKVKDGGDQGQAKSANSQVTSTNGSGKNETKAP